jgi:hypothetical protein
MQRVFSAIEAEESEILNQIENDVDIALEDNKIQDEEYDMDKLSDSTVIVRDKVNDEITEINQTDNENVMSEITPIDYDIEIVYDKDGEKVNGKMLGVGETAIKVGPDDFIPANQVDSVVFSNDMKGTLKSGGLAELIVGDHKILVDFKKRLAQNADDPRQMWEWKPSDKLSDVVLRIKKELGVKSFSKK